MLAMNPRQIQTRPSRRRPQLEYFTGEAGLKALRDRRVHEELAAALQRSDAIPDLCFQAERHVTIASDRETGGPLALVAATCRYAADDAFLFVEHAALPRTSSAGALLRRLIAMALLRIAGPFGLPAAIATMLPSGLEAELFLSLGRHFTGSASYPPAPGTPIALRSAQLAKRIAGVVAPSIHYNLATSALRGACIKGNLIGDLQDVYGTSTAVSLMATQPSPAHKELLLLIDLRSEDETVLLDDARQAYRKP